jgi:hypothetical protein
MDSMASHIVSKRILSQQVYDKVLVVRVVVVLVDEAEEGVELESMLDVGLSGAENFRMPKFLNNLIVVWRKCCRRSSLTRSSLMNMNWLRLLYWWCCMGRRFCATMCTCMEAYGDWRSFKYW